MKNVTEFPNRNIIEQEAVEWLIRLDGDEAPSQEELEALREWMATSPAHTEEMEKLGAFWSDLVLTELNIPLVKANSDLLKAGKTHHQKYAGVTESDNSVSPWQKLWPVAAGIFAVVILVQQMLFPFDESGLQETNGHYATAIGKQTTIPLADGSVVKLNTNSQIEVEYTREYRNIRLVQGEAHFEVAKNAEMPFRVYAGDGRVEAVGTAFSVYLREKHIDVLVTEGKVALATQVSVPPDIDSQSSQALIEVTDGDETSYYLAIPADSVGLLEEGQGATILFASNDKSGEEEPVAEVKPMDSTVIKRRDAWRNGLMIFTGESLEEVVGEVSRYTAVSIEIVDPDLKQIRIGGQFRVGDLSGMFDVLETNFNLSVIRLDENRVQIASAGK